MEVFLYFLLWIFVNINLIFCKDKIITDAIALYMYETFQEMKQILNLLISTLMYFFLNFREQTKIS